jgi:hypothetical protein
MGLIGRHVRVESYLSGAMRFSGVGGSLTYVFFWVKDSIFHACEEKL